MIAVLLLGYLLEVLGTLWPDAAFLQPYTPFHYLRPLEILGGRGEPADMLVLAGDRGRGRGLRAVALPAPGPRRADLIAPGRPRGPGTTVDP